MFFLEFSILSPIIREKKQQPIADITVPLPKFPWVRKKEDDFKKVDWWSTFDGGFQI